MTTFNFFSIVDLMAVQIGNGSTKLSTKIWIVNSAKSDKEGDEEQNDEQDEEQNQDDEDGDTHKEGDFVAKFNFIKQQFCGQDDLVTGFLSKAKGQLLRVAACLHVLFKVETPTEIDATIDLPALKAAINFIEVCCEHAFMITGRHNILHRLEGNNDGMCIVCTADYQVLELAS